jgi:CRISPR-associated protein Cas2
MSFSEKRSWLVCYDIRDPRRLGRVHRYLKRHALPVQYSAFVTRSTQYGLDEMLAGIAARIDPRCDDVRAYHLPDRCEVWTVGAQHLPVGIVLPAKGLVRLLNRLTPEDVEVSVADTVADEEEG